MRPGFWKQLPKASTLGICLVLTALWSLGCSVKSDLMSHLSQTILNNNDLEMVEAGAPAYLLMVDSLISQDPESEKILSTGARLYTAYADVFVTDKERSKKLSDKALGYAENALCLANEEGCGLRKLPFEAFKTRIWEMDEDDLPYLFGMGNAWASWIMSHRDDFNAIADLSRIEAVMNRVIAIDEHYQDGAAYLYLATLSTLLPPALGGKPEQGKIYFEKAIELSGGKNLMIKVMYAKLYAKMIFDRPLHDRLLTEVLETDPNIPGYVLINTYAKRSARQLMDEADDYF